MTRARALHAVGLATLLLAALAFAAANFVLVDVRVLVFGFQSRLAWVVLVPVVVAYVAGVVYGRNSEVPVGRHSQSRRADSNR